MGLFRPAKVVRQAGRAAPTNFLGYVLLFLAMATGMLNRFLASALWPLLVTLLVLGLSWQYVAGWLDALREWRRPTPSARRPTATPVTKQELQARLIVAERLELLPALTPTLVRTLGPDPNHSPNPRPWPCPGVADVQHPRRAPCRGAAARLLPAALREARRGAHRLRGTPSSDGGGGGGGGVLGAVWCGAHPR